MQAQRMQWLNPYKPGEQPKDRQYIKLNANENPYPPSDLVRCALADFISTNPMSLALYPDPDSKQLREAIAGLLNQTGGVLCRTQISSDGMCRPAQQDALPFQITPDMVFVGNGSDEVLSFVFYAFFDGDRPLVQPEHTYSFYPVYAGYYGIPLKKVPLSSNFSIDCSAMLDVARSNDTSMILANPNAPTGLGLSRDQVRNLLAAAPRGRVHVVDEAYVDFGGESCLSLFAELPNLVVVRTFSKSLSFAGMRLGYAVANPELVAALHCVKDSFNHFPVDALAQVAGSAACSSVAYYAECARKIADERDSFCEFLRGRGWYVLPSCTNFVFASKPGVAGDEVYRFLKSRGILVRHFSAEGTERFVRITIGTPSQMAELKSMVEQSGDLL